MTFITLLTDFETRDGFAAAMKGVILSIAPEARVIDAAHSIGPGDIDGAAWALTQYWGRFPEGTVHLAVVDPGVGSARRGIAVEAGGRIFVGPDNGLVSLVLQLSPGWRGVELAESEFRLEPVSQTFHGRDVFAPAAAHIAAGVSLERLGPPVGDPVLLPIARVERSERELRGRVAHIDRFGNLITDIPVEWVGDGWRFEVAGRDVGYVRESYSAVEPGELLVVPGSAGTMEVAARESSAADVLDVSRGTVVVARRDD